MSFPSRLATRIVLAAPGLMMMLSHSAAASPVASDALLDLPLEQLLSVDVSTASRFQQTVTDAPSAVTVVTYEDIKAFGWRTLAEILGSIRTLYVTNDRNYSYLGGRGFARPGDYNSRFLLLVDGVRTNDAIYDQASIGREFLINVDLIERVEFVPGSGSSVYGSNAFFGVINVITKSGRRFTRPEGSIEIGSAGERKARASYGFRDQYGGEFLLSASSFHRSGNDQYYPEFDTPANNNGVAHNLDYERGGNLFFKGLMGPLTLELAHVERTRGVPTASFGQAFNDPRSKTRDEETIAAIAYRSDLNEETSLNAQLSLGQQIYGGVYAYANPTYLNLDSSSSTWSEAQISLLSTHWRNHKLLGGVEFQYNLKRDQRSVNRYPAASPDAPVYSNAAQDFTLLDDQRNGSRAGIYLQDEFTLREDLLLNIGGRYDYNSEVDGAFSPRFAVIYKATPQTTLKAISGNAFRAPNAFEMYYRIPGAGGQMMNADLDPERIHSQELVMEHNLSRDARLTISAFRNEVSNLISQTEDASTGMLIYRNLARSTARGIEFEYEQVWSSGWKIRASQSWQTAKDADTGERLTNSPTSLSNVNLLAPVWQNRATLGLDARYVGERRTLNGQLDGYWLASLTLFSEKLLNKTRVSVSIYNLFDKQYADPGAAEHVQDVIPQEGRSVRLKVSHSF